MKIKDDFVLRDVFGEKTVFAVGNRGLTRPVTIRLNDTAAYIWKQLSKECSIDELVNSVKEKYAVDSDTAKKAVEIVIKRLKEAECIE